MEIKPAYVTFEQAKWLKEKKFGLSEDRYIQLHSFYDKKGNLTTQPSVYKRDISKTHLGALTIGNVEVGVGQGLDNSLDDIYLAPEQWQVVEWLRVKHGIWISVDCDCYGGLWYSKLSVASEKNWDNLNKRHTIVSAFHKFNNEHKSPEEATLAAIDYILKELI